MKTTIKNNLESVKEYLNDLSGDDLLNIHNEYCREHDPDNEIYNNDEEFFSVFFNNPLDAVRAVCYGEYNYTDEYVKFDGYANLESFDEHEIIDYVDIDELAEDILKNPRNYYDIELEEEEEEEE